MKPLKPSHETNETTRFQESFKIIRNNIKYLSALKPMKPFKNGFINPENPGITG